MSLSNLLPSFSFVMLVPPLPPTHPHPGSRLTTFGAGPRRREDEVGLVGIAVVGGAGREEQGEPTPTVRPYQ